MVGILGWRNEEMIKRMLTVAVIWGMVWIIQSGAPEEHFDDMALVGQKEVTICK